LNNDRVAFLLEEIRESNRHGLFYDGLHYTLIRLIDEQAVVLVETPSEYLSDLINCEAHEITTVDLHNILQPLDPLRLLLGGGVQGSVAELSFVVHAPRPDVALGVEGEDMRTPSSYSA